MDWGSCTWFRHLAGANEAATYRRDPYSSRKKSFFQPAVPPTTPRFWLKLSISGEPGRILLLIIESMHLIHGVAGYIHRARQIHFQPTMLRASVFEECHHGCTFSKPRDYGFHLRRRGWAYRGGGRSCYDLANVPRCRLSRATRIGCLQSLWVTRSLSARLIV